MSEDKLSADERLLLEFIREKVGKRSAPLIEFQKMHQMTAWQVREIYLSLKRKGLVRAEVKGYSKLNPRVTFTTTKIYPIDSSTPANES
jgi:hypothetical protein